MTEPVSVIIPAWRAAATIGRALASVAAQTVPPAEVVVVDDGSDDGTLDAAEACRPLLAERGIALIAERQPNQGAGAARNRAIALSSGSLLAFLDADDEWLPEKLERSLAELGSHAFVSHDMLVVGEGGETVADCARHFPQGGDAFLALFQRGFVATSTVLARRDAVLAAGGFDPALRAAQDYDLWLKLAASGLFHVFAGALTRYHVTPGGITGNVERRRLCSLAVLDRHRPALAGRRGGWAALAKRALIIQYEAASAHAARGRRLLALCDAAVAPLMVLRALGGPALMRALPWAWVLAAAVAYGWQFREIARPILAAAGLG